MTEPRDTKTRIMDSAEALFAEAGFDAVPIREIMRRADARLGLMSYYFESKEALLEAVIARRIDVLSSERKNRLLVFAGTSESSIEKIVDAFIDPFLEMMTTKNDGWRNYGRLIAHLAQSSRWIELIHKYFDATSELFIAELKRICPNVSDDKVVRGYVCTVGAMLHIFSITGRMRMLSDGKVDDEEIAKSGADLKTFISSGLKGTLTEGERRG